MFMYKKHISIPGILSGRRYSLSASQILNQVFQHDVFAGAHHTHPTGSCFLRRDSTWNFTASLIWQNVVVLEALGVSSGLLGTP